MSKYVFPIYFLSLPRIGRYRDISVPSLIPRNSNNCSNNYFCFNFLMSGCGGSKPDIFSCINMYFLIFHANNLHLC